MSRRVSAPAEKADTKGTSQSTVVCVDSSEPMVNTGNPDAEADTSRSAENVSSTNCKREEQEQLRYPQSDGVNDEPFPRSSTVEIGVPQEQCQPKERRGGRRWSRGKRRGRGSIGKAT